MMQLKVLGCRVDAYSFDETISKLVDAIDQKKGGYHACLNAAKVVDAQSSVWLREYFAAANLVSADGFSVVMAARLLGFGRLSRVTGIDLFFSLLEKGSSRGWRILLIGSSEETLRKVSAKISQDFDGIEIVKTVDGYNLPSFATLSDYIHVTRADVCFIALPSPLKEEMILELNKRSHSTLLFGVGGSFEILAGNLKRAPKWVQRAGFEWLFRLSQEFRRMFKRYLVGNSKFMFILFRALLQNNSNRNN